MPWPEQGERRLAGISSFGLSGTNAHVIIGDPRPTGSAAATEAADEHGALLLPISARSRAAREELAGRYLELLRTAPETPAVDVCASAARRRSHHDHRLAAVGRDRDDLVAALEAFLRGDENRDLIVGVDRRSADLTVFVFPGQGSQWAGMARDLLRHEPVFRRAIERCQEAVAPHVDWSLLEVLEDPAGARLDEIDVVQPVLFAVQVALAAWWEAAGVRPDAVVGHSMGEVAAAHIAGALTLEDAARIICVRSQLLRRIAGRGAMAVVDLDVDGARRAMAGVEDRLSVAVSNSRSSTVLSGDPAALDAVMARLERAGTFCRRVRVDVASHSPQVDELLDDLHARLASVRPVRGNVPFLSTVSGEMVDGSALDAAYWGENVRRPVRFADAVDALIARGHGRFVEMTAHPLLTGAIREALHHASRDGVALASLHRDADGPTELRKALASLYVDGLAVDWARIQPARPPTDVPFYAWQHQRYWLGAHDADTDADSGGAELMHAVRWRPAPDAGLVRPEAVDRWLVVAAEGIDAAAYARALGDAAVLALPDAGPDAIATILDAAADGHLGVVVLTGGADDLPAAAMADRQCRHVATIARVVGTLDRRRAGAHVWLVTHGAQRARPGDQVSGWVNGTLWGLGRAIGEELPHLWGGCVDLDATASPQQAAAALAHELTHVAADGQAEGEVALRDGQRFVARLAPAEVGAPAPLALPVDGTVLVTGGFGAVGREVARWLVEHGARRIVLVGRTELPPRAEWAGRDPDSPAGRRAACVRQLEALGAAVHVAAVDVGDEVALVSFLDTFRQEGWPPIRAVFHAAAQFGGDLVGDLDDRAVRAQLLPKLVGASIFHDRVPDLQHFVLFSSAAGSLPMAGQSAYAAANSFLDSLAQHRAATGRPAISIGWGFWEGSDEEAPGETGRGRVDGGRSYKEIATTLAADQGIHGFDVDQGLVALHRLMVGSEPATVVAAIDWARLGAARIAAIGGLATDRVGAAGPGDGTARASLVAEMAEAAPSEQQDVAEAAVRRVVSRVLKLSQDGIDGTTPFGSLGLDSLMSVELRNLLERELGSKLSATLAWNYPTVRELAAYLVSRVAGTEAPPAFEAAVVVDVDPRLEGLAAKVGELSEDEALAALIGGEQR